MGRYAMWLAGGAGDGGGSVTKGLISEGRGEYRTSGRLGTFAVHFPTPVIINDQRARLDKVIVLYETSPGTKINSVRIYDGPRLVAERTDFPRGDHSGGLALENVIDVKPPPEVMYGLQMFVSFESEGAVAILFCRGFGADFLA